LAASSFAEACQAEAGRNKLPADAFLVEIKVASGKTEKKLLDRFFLNSDQKKTMSRFFHSPRKNLVFLSGLPDDIFSNKKITIRVNFGGSCNT
jgi:hypothetical protein